jgi:hypothetical protein
LILFKNCDKIIKRMVEVKMNNNTLTLITQAWQLLDKLPEDRETKEVLRQLITTNQFINNKVEHLKIANKDYGTQHWEKIMSLEKENSRLRLEIEQLREQYEEFAKIKATVMRIVWAVVTSSPFLGGAGAIIYEGLLK